METQTSNTENEVHQQCISRVLARAVRAPSGCLEWTGASGSKGYGRLKYRGRLYLPHRIALEASLGRALCAGELALHACDNPRCVNADHLFVGTYRDNVIDAIRKGRMKPLNGPSEKCRAAVSESNRRRWREYREKNGRPR